MRAALDALVQGKGPHFMTGPVFVAGAEPGDTLQVDILDVTVSQDWGFVSILPLLGTLPDEFTDYETIHPEVDHARQVCTMPWGTEIPLAPFFGIIGGGAPARLGRAAAPPCRAPSGATWTTRSSRPARRSTCRSSTPGALFMAGDGHGVQGDGEVCITALETGVTGTLPAHGAQGSCRIQRPFAETPTHLLSIGLDEDLDDAAKQAVREMVDHVCRRTALTRNQAYMLCSLAGDLRVTQLVDGNKGVHMLLAKSRL